MHGYREALADRRMKVEPYTGEPYWDRDWEGGAVTLELVRRWGLLVVIMGVLVRYWKLW